MNITVRRIADHTGLSIATVSRILNGKGAHSPRTIARVRRVADSLSRRKSAGTECENIGIVLLAYPHFLCEIYTSAMLSAILETLTAKGAVAQLIPLGASPLTLEDAERLVDRFGLSGFLVQELGRLDQVTGPLDKLPVPVVRIGSGRQNDHRHVVYCDHRRIGADAAAYLWNLGFRCFGVVYADTGDYGQEQRQIGFTEQLIRFGSLRENIWIESVPHVTLEGGITASTDFMKLEKRPQALFFAQSGLARMFLSQVRRSGIAIPRELFILSTEDCSELTDAELPIATISFPTRELGSTAAAMLIDLIRNNAKSGIQKQRVACDPQIHVGPACLMSLQSDALSLTHNKEKNE
ncbi:LacI family DNA-binding transcriptional regulator [Victivallis vadensis]|jgi:transcriptional regulator, lacI family|uniref:LacI family DNA-binding transcriptional regulator n=1 Tax=Victivallis vadensis TaxID=172901 RepID=UPI00266D0D3B|nr:LacI family DNA-binding transcriptional regulator [Victivallis vadensis]